MGDQVWTRINVTGELKDEGAFTALVEALGEDLGDIMISKKNISTRESGAIKQALIDANLEGGGLHIEGSSRNAYVGTIKQVAMKHKIDIHVNTSGWGGWGPTVFIVKDGHLSQNLTEDGNSLAVSRQTIAKLMQRGMTSLAELNEFLDHYDFSDQPEFSIPDEVIAALFIPKRN